MCIRLHGGSSPPLSTASIGNRVGVAFFCGSGKMLMQALRAGWPEAAPVFNRQMEFILCIMCGLFHAENISARGDLCVALKCLYSAPIVRLQESLVPGKRFFLTG